MRLAREYDREQESGQEEGDGCGQVERSQAPEICPGNLQRDRNMQDDLEHHQHDHGIHHAQQRGERARGYVREPGFQQVGEHAAGAQSEQGNRNREKGEVVEQHDGKQPGQRQFQQHCGETGEREARQQSFFRDFKAARSWGRSRGDDGHKWNWKATV